MSQLGGLKHLSQGTLKYTFKCFVFVAFEVPLDQDNPKNLDSLPILHAVTTKVVVMVRDRVRDRVIIFQIRAGN